MGASLCNQPSSAKLEVMCSLAATLDPHKTIPFNVQRARAGGKVQRFATVAQESCLGQYTLKWQLSCPTLRGVKNEQTELCIKARDNFAGGPNRTFPFNEQRARIRDRMQKLATFAQHIISLDNVDGRRVARPSRLVPRRR
jgi:hypothetical protein